VGGEGPCRFAARLSFYFNFFLPSTNGVRYTSRAMASGRELRANIDVENFKGLLLVNGGGSVALLAFLPSVLEKPGYEALACYILWGLLWYQVGLVSALIHNRLTRKCSLIYDQHDMHPPAGNFWASPNQASAM
jgi:hypothetical protein